MCIAISLQLQLWLQLWLQLAAICGMGPSGTADEGRAGRAAAAFGGHNSAYSQNDVKSFFIQ